MADHSPSSDDSFAQLRSIIVGPERRRLRALRKHVLDPRAQTRDVSRVLPDALQLRARDPQLMRALAPSVEEAITASVQKNPQALADALFPVIGPAIRKAVAHTFDAMIDSVNQTIERSVSWQALQWRFTAWRTGRPFAEVLIANTVEYRVEQVFLIHRESGLLLQHVAIDRRSGQDADQISAMLTAITDFARDSFHVAGADTLESMRVGDLAVTIAPGPHAILAAVVRGSIPPPVRAAFEAALESVHRQFGPALQAFSGDAAPFAPARALLEACLVSQRRHKQQRPSYRGWAIAAALAVVVLGLWLYVDVRDRRRWNAYLDRLAAEPGVVVLASGKRDGAFFVTGLRDPLARDPAEFVSAVNIAPASVRSRWEPYQALHPAFVTARAQLMLRPPQGISLVYEQGVLTASGSAPQQWIDDTERMAPAIAGVRQFTFRGESTESRLIGEIEQARIGFPRGQSAIAPAQQPVLEALLTNLRQLNAALASSRRYAVVEILGYASSDGPDELNVALSRARAERVYLALSAESLAHVQLSPLGLGRASVLKGSTEAEHDRNRRASFRVQLTDAPPAKRAAMIQKKICLLGGFGVGKTSLVAQFVHSIFSEKYLTTIGVKIDKKSVPVDQTQVELIIWDIYGHDDFQELRSSYLRGAGGYLLVADGTRRATLDTVDELQRLTENNVGPVPFALAVNKADLRDQWQIDDAAIEERRRAGWHVVETSAKTGDMVEDAFATLARAMLAHTPQHRHD